MELFLLQQKMYLVYNQSDTRIGLDAEFQSLIDCWVLSFLDNSLDFLDNSQLILPIFQNSKIAS